MLERWLWFRPESGAIKIDRLEWNVYRDICFRWRSLVKILRCIGVKKKKNQIFRRHWNVCVCVEMTAVSAKSWMPAHSLKCSLGAFRLSFVEFWFLACHVAVAVAAAIVVVMVVTKCVAIDACRNGSKRRFNETQLKCDVVWTWTNRMLAALENFANIWCVYACVCIGPVACAWILNRQRKR